MYHRLYHLHMPREDSLSSRFDYLFEPLDVEESTGAAIETEGSLSESAHGTSSPRAAAAPVRMAFAAFVLATLAVVAVIAVLLVQRPTEPTDPIEAPLEPTPLSTVAEIPSRAAPIPPAPTVAVPTEAPHTVDSGPHRVFVPEPAPTPTPTPRQSQGGVSISPSTRAPISVAPATRPPFPNQPPRGGGQNGGLLGGLL